MRTIKALIKGTWHDSLEETPAVRAWMRSAGAGFRHRVSTDSGAEFPAQPNRYHLYVSFACPWAHRTIIYRRLKKLEKVISMSVLHPRWAGQGGWRFAEGQMSSIDHVGARSYLYQVYQATQTDYTGRTTVPVLWDRYRKTIVNNESADIMRMLNSVFDRWGDRSVDFYPRAMRREIDAMNAWLIPNICVAVYRVGFADSQSAYDLAIDGLFDSLDELETRLERQPYLLGQQITESDWHLFATLCRFDAVYFGALKCNLRRLTDYPALSDYARRLHMHPGVAQTVRFDHIKQHYYDTIGEINHSIVPRGPTIDYRNRQSCDVDASKARTTTQPTSERLFICEVQELHRYLEQWMKGEIPNPEKGPTRLADFLAEDFKVIHPTGQYENKKAVLRNFDAAYGKKPADYALVITDPAVQVLHHGLCLVSYRESHRGEPGRNRFCSALLRQRTDGTGIEWLFLQETFAAAPSNVKGTHLFF